MPPSAACILEDRGNPNTRNKGGGGGGGYLQIQKNAARHVLASTGLGEERVERVVTATDSLVGGHLSIGLDAVLQAIQLPAGIADLRISQITFTAVPSDPVPERSSVNGHELKQSRRHHR